MGKKRRLNQLISKWIKRGVNRAIQRHFRTLDKSVAPIPVEKNQGEPQLMVDSDIIEKRKVKIRNGDLFGMMIDLPEDRSTVLLLGVTRIPTSPAPTRRPCSLALTSHNHHSFPALVEGPQVRRNSLSSSRRGVVRRNSSRKREGRHYCQVPIVNVTSLSDCDRTKFSTKFDENRVNPQTSLTPSNCFSHDGYDDVATPTVMERSVDSIGTCSLDVEASVCDVSDWSELSSVGTLRSTNLVTPSPPEPHLPSYLSLACTVNGYSTTTNYDPIRLARSRDASPHRIDSDLTPNKVTYSVQNNLLSPPNLVPLPTRSKPKSEMGENTLTQHHHQEFYSSTKTMSFMSKETHFASNLFSTKDTIDGCLENGHHNIHSKCVSFESKNITSINGQNKCTSETSIRQEFSNGNETKSFIQQRVERLYGPGALAQGFFVSKRQKNRLSESEDKNTSLHSEKHSKSMTDKLIEDDLEPSMKQSTSSPTLPVLRHLRPEFRAQLPIISPRKGVESLMQKSVTVPKLKDETKVNGHSSTEEEVKLSALKDVSNGHAELIIKEKSDEKDGHYFLKILEEQTERLLQLAARVESEISTPDLSEEIIGKLRSAAGKARLLVSQKMQQFKGLCTNNINQSVGEAFPTTNEDLQGFWDMVMLQVDQVDALFEEINTLKKNNWQEVAKVEKKVNINGTAKPKKTVSRPRPTSAANEEARKQREAERKKMIEERRKAMKAQQSKPRESIEIFVPESS